MKEKKEYKIGLLPLVLLILDIILILVVIVMGFIIYSQKKTIENNNLSYHQNEVQSENNDELVQNSVLTDERINENTANTRVENNIRNGNSNTSVNTINEKNDNLENLQQYTKKIVENRPYIYDAQYTPNGVKATRYSLNDGTNYSISDIVVPYINMESNDASSINSEIEKLYNQYVEEFKVCSQSQNSYIKVKYNTYITSNIYSVVLNIQRGQENDNTEEYVAYNFDIISGTKLDYNQVCYIAGISNAGENIQKTLDNLEDYREYYLVAGRDVSQEAIDARAAEIDAYKNQIYTCYQEDLLNNKLVYFLDNNLKLNILMKIVLPNNEGSYNKIITIES